MDENNSDTPAAERQSMRDFWKEHSKDASQEEMMLDNNAATLSQQEIPEILDLLPNTQGKTVLEIGAGIGRYTRYLARQSKKVIAVDFMQTFIEKNKIYNEEFSNIEFKVADATHMHLAENSVDVVFTNWLMMYMTDTEVEKFFTNVLDWLTPDGYLFFRESCYHNSGDAKRTTNPTHYRTPLDYTCAFNLATVTTNGDDYGFKLLFSKNIDTYIELKANCDQICWLVQKKFKKNQKLTLPDQMALHQHEILCKQRVCGDNCMRAGEKEIIDAFLKDLNLKPLQKMLVVGSGIGGSAFYMNEVKFLNGDVTTYEFPVSSFDVVFCHDVMTHIADKPAVVARFNRWLRPGGTLLISAYCCNQVKSLPKAEPNGHLSDLSPCFQYKDILQRAGFTDVITRDKTELMTESLKTDLQRANLAREDLLQEFSKDVYDTITSSLSKKMISCTSGKVKYVIFLARTHFI